MALKERKWQKKFCSIWIASPGLRPCLAMTNLVFLCHAELDSASVFVKQFFQIPKSSSILLALNSECVATCGCLTSFVPKLAGLCPWLAMTKSCHAELVSASAFVFSQRFFQIPK